MKTTHTAEQLKSLCEQLVHSMVGAEHSTLWWSSPNRAFNDRTPNEQWEKGSDQVINYLMHHSFSGGGS